MQAASRADASARPTATTACYWMKVTIDGSNRFDAGRASTLASRPPFFFGFSSLSLFLIAQCARFFGSFFMRGVLDRFSHALSVSSVSGFIAFTLV